MTADPLFEIEDRAIGPGEPTYVVAELSGNHRGDKERALDLVDAAAEAGADAVKLQTYTADTMTIDSDRDPFQIQGGTLWDGRTLYDLYEEAHTPWEWQPDLKDRAESHGLHCFSSAFDSSAVDFLEKMDVPAHKIASFEITHIPLIEKIARHGKPIIMSTGMATMAEIDEAVRTVRENGDLALALMHCNSAYPARPDEMNLRTIPHMSEAWDVPVGLSDHTLGSTSAVVAVTFGASMVEKHFTLDRADGGPDAEFSMEPDEFEEMVEQIRVAEKARGEVRYGPSEKEEDSLVFRESIFAVEDIEEGEELTEDNVDIIRPSEGIAPKFISHVLGSTAKQDIPRGRPLEWSLFT